jgi:pimeloyl-ACP methyl ester carboxylesterase
MMSVFMDIEGKALKRVMLITSHILLAKSNSWLNVDISAKKARWPLLVMSHGLKASPEIYSAYAEYFASIGYIVAAPAHTDGSCPENWKGQGPGKWSWEFSNAQLRQRVQDIKFMTNFLASDDSSVSSRIDWENCLVCGHSFGGATTVGVLKHDDRFHTGVCWDSWMWSLSPADKTKPTDKQILYINSEWFVIRIYHFVTHILIDYFASVRFLVGEGREVNLESVNQVCRSNTSGGHVTLLKDTAHHNYNDLPLLVHPSLQKLMRSSTGPPKMFGKLPAYV